MSDINPIRNRDDYNKAVALLADLIEANPVVGTPEDTKIRVLTNLIEDFENATLPDYEVYPIEAIKFRMEQQGLTVKDLEPAIGKSNRVYEVLNRKRNLTLPMIRKLHSMFGIPLKSLVGG